MSVAFFSDSYRTQTCNLLIRSQMLYSIELRSRSALRPLLCLFGYALFLDASLLTGKIAKVEDARPADFTNLVDSDAVDSGRLERENPFYAYAAGDFANCESAGERSGTADLDDHATEVLQTILVAFLDFAGNGDGITGLELRIICDVLVKERLLCNFK